MHFSIQREALLKPLQLVAGVVERRQTLPVLSNVLLVVQGQQLSLTGTDLEVELVGRVALEDAAEPGEITVPARKLMDICKSLPSDALISIRLDDQKVVIKSGRSRFTLSTLPANDFPTVEEGPGSLSFTVAQGKLRKLIERSAFAMAQQDVRYYLNGMLIEVSSGMLRAVATDGHRLAMCSMQAGIEQPDRHQVIVPRKGILELARLLNDQDAEVSIVLGQHHIRAPPPASSPSPPSWWTASSPTTSACCRGAVTSWWSVIASCCARRSVAPRSSPTKSTAAFACSWKAAC